VSRTITISPITRLEGHGKIDIFLDDAGEVERAFFQVVELRGFERFCEGRPVVEMPRITPKICGVCPGAHHMASAKACDAVYGVQIPSAARKLRELFYNAHIAHSHMLHFFALGAPDFVPGSQAPAAQRNLIGLIGGVGEELGRSVLRHRGMAQKIQGILAGHPIHPVSALPGGMSRALSDAERDEIAQMGDSLVEFAASTVGIFEGLLADPAHKEAVEGDTYYHETYYAGLVDDAGHVNFYDGKIRVVDPKGHEHACFEAKDYQDHVAERVEPWSYMKFPFLKDVGWKGLADGMDSGVFRVNALARLNVASGMATPKAQEAYERLYAHFGTKPVHNTLAYHWARLIETLFACEEVARLAKDPEITSKDIRTVPTGKPTEGVGVVEAARGTLYHHYVTDAKGMLKKVNLIVATVQNNAAMNMSVERAAKKLIHGGKVDDALLNRVEMAFRAYDPCLACATHAVGQMPLEARIHHNGDTQLIRR
jgi:F420-non-reducing hydrogenase large subunit